MRSRPSVQFAARLHGTAFFRPFGLFRYRRLLRCLHGQYFGIGSIEVYILVGLVFTGLISAAFGYVCVRHTRIFFGILTLALSQVLWTLAYKFFWVTGGTDGLRVAFANLTLLGGSIDFKGRNAYQAFVHSYYYYVLFLFCVCTLLMWVIVHSPFGKALQADSRYRRGPSSWEFQSGAIAGWHSCCPAALPASPESSGSR